MNPHLPPLYRTQARLAELAAQESCTFSPATNPTSTRLLERSQDIPIDFLERQVGVSCKSTVPLQTLALLTCILTVSMATASPL